VRQTVLLLVWLLVLLLFLALSLPLLLQSSMHEVTAMF
jgi:hypothetical protein